MFLLEERTVVLLLLRCCVVNRVHAQHGQLAAVAVLLLVPLTALLLEHNDLAQQPQTRQG